MKLYELKKVEIWLKAWTFCWWGMWKVMRVVVESVMWIWSLIIWWLVHILERYNLLNPLNHQFNC